DEQGVHLIHDWIQSLPLHKEENALIEKLAALDKRSNSARGKKSAGERAEAINRLLSSTSSALLLAQALADNRIPDSVRPQVLAAAMARPEPQVQDLFERFIPDDQRIKPPGSP